jgi:hypothetical protein
MRQRTLSPGFFVNEDLLTLSPLHRLLFAGLWCLADRQGRLEDRPRKIKLQILAGDDCDVDGMLTDLAEHKLIIRYESDGKRLIAIPAWSRHQHPHPNEIASTFNGPNGEPPDQHQGPLRVKSRLTTRRTKARRTQAGSSEPSESSESSGSTRRESPDSNALVALWNSTAHPSLPRCEGLKTETRKEAARKLLEIVPLDQWPSLIANANASDFCKGATGGTWHLSLAGMLKQPELALKVLEGNYANGSKPDSEIRKGHVRAEDMDWSGETTRRVL